MNIHKQIDRERGVHGQQWDKMHDGYFADAAIALPLMEKISHHLKSSQSEVIVDLGGGTGFILLELMAKGWIKNIIPINLDCSSTQLDAMKKIGISCINSMISDFNRHDIAIDKQIFFIMRSVLHYFGREGLIPVLHHIRNQAREGEIFINQTACFENELEARCINALYREMGTPKWYPMVSELHESMAAANWQVMEVLAAPPLKLASVELGQRYGLNRKALKKISGRIMDEFGEIDNVFRLVPDGFIAYLHYNICVARAA